MTSKSFFLDVVFIFLTILRVYCAANEDFFYKVSLHDKSDNQIHFELPFERVKRTAAEPLENKPKNTSVPLITNMTNITKNIGNGTHILEQNKQGQPQQVDLELPQTITNETLIKNNITRTKNDSHIYYNSTAINDSNIFKKYWKELKNNPNANVHEMLSDSHRRAATVNLTFQFPFYGHLINTTTIATGGFLYLGDYIHSWLAATQYVAPLMANFDLSVSNESNIYFMDNGTAFTVTWQNVTLQDKPKAGEFTFQTTLHSNGNIVFAYKYLPMSLKAIDASSHPVKIGLSDAYVLDKTVFFVRRKTIYEYHRVTFNDDEVTNSTVIVLTALPTCLEKKNCTSCVKKDTNFQCFWCDNRCSSGLDRNRQDWHKKDCEKLKLMNEEMCINGITTPHPPNMNTPTMEKSSDLGPHTAPSSNTSLFFIALCLSLLVMSTVWILYAYLYPHTRSGQLLIRYRPSQWGWRRGEARYTAATIHM
ncbi:plexin domain-containing protein 2-like isoform X2 [Adelges cooleyi]|uniref:plexin domain-containing protein 2-like isoform X2 n=1 Tax=Adelges cooleyi TaxID=133065 RepID=UPI00217F6FEA|nr:plexin domain-containing protein 2-like isoform X2 [Adelges cooleyi]